MSLKSWWAWGNNIMCMNNKSKWEFDMTNKFRYKNWTFVEYINPKHKTSWDTEEFYNPKRSRGYYDGVYRSRPNESHVYERIMDWFKHIEKDKSEIDLDVIWDSLDDDEAAEWFKNSKRNFIKWWGSLSPKLQVYYADRIRSGKSLLPEALPGVPDYDDDSTMRITLIDNNKLALSSHKLSVLDSALEIIQKLRGKTDYEHRKQTNSSGTEIHTYIFDLK